MWDIFLKFICVYVLLPIFLDKNISYLRPDIPVLSTLYFQCLDRGLTYRNYSLYRCFLFFFFLYSTHTQSHTLLCNLRASIDSELITALNLFNCSYMYSTLSLREGKNMCQVFSGHISLNF